jgi:hypothetical protein
MNCSQLNKFDQVILNGNIPYIKTTHTQFDIKKYIENTIQSFIMSNKYPKIFNYEYSIINQIKILSFIILKNGFKDTIKHTKHYLRNKHHYVTLRTKLCYNPSQILIKQLGKYSHINNFIKYKNNDITKMLNKKLGKYSNINKLKRYKTFNNETYIEKDNVEMDNMEKEPSTLFQTYLPSLKKDTDENMFENLIKSQTNIDLYSHFKLSNKIDHLKYDSII